MSMRTIVNLKSRRQRYDMLKRLQSSAPLLAAASLVTSLFVLPKLAFGQ
jgi:hypothetical protein